MCPMNSNTSTTGNMFCTCLANYVRPTPINVDQGCTGNTAGCMYNVMFSYNIAVGGAKSILVIDSWWCMWI